MMAANLIGFAVRALTIALTVARGLGSTHSSEPMAYATSLLRSLADGKVRVAYRF